MIEQAGSDPVRQRFSWSYKMFPNKYLVGKACAGPDAHHSGPTGNNGPTGTDPVGALTTQPGDGLPFRSTCSRRLPILHRKPYCRGVEGMAW